MYNALNTTWDFLRFSYRSLANTDAVICCWDVQSAQGKRTGNKPSLDPEVMKSSRSLYCTGWNKIMSHNRGDICWGYLQTLRDLGDRSTNQTNAAMAMKTKGCPILTLLTVYSTGKTGRGDGLAVSWNSDENINIWAQLDQFSLQVRHY